MRSHLLIPIFVLLASAHAAAQGSANRGELFAGAGASRVGGDEGSLGNGPYVFLTPRFSLRLQFRLVFSEATGVMGLAAASMGIGYHWWEFEAPDRA